MNTSSPKPVAVRNAMSDILALIREFRSPAHGGERMPSHPTRVGETVSSPTWPGRAARKGLADPDREEARAALHRARHLLKGGMVAEAVAILRGLPQTGRSRAEAVALSLAAARLDPEFQAEIAHADQERDACNWGVAEYHYWRALQFYPLHHGYLVQYGHCLKEQSKLEDAEATYRSALALGAPAEDVRLHVAFVCAALGLVDAPLPGGAVEAAGEPTLPLDQPPIRADVELLFALLLQRPPRTMTEVLALLRAATTCREVVRMLIEHEEFPPANRDLMVLLAQST